MQWYGDQSFNQKSKLWSLDFENNARLYGSDVSLRAFSICLNIFT